MSVEGAHTAGGHATGRLTEAVHPDVRAITMDAAPGSDFTEELEDCTEIDRAHLVMLADTGVLAEGVASRLLDEIGALRADGFHALRERSAPRGWYLMYEAYLIERTGPDIGGVLQLGRSRNDLSATLTLLSLRRAHLRVVRGMLRLLLCLLRQARRHDRTVMPLYTHYQPALPSTYGHYLTGVATSLAADLRAMRALSDELDTCPLGAGAVGGTSVEIDPDRTAGLLGFSHPCRNSVAAVASRDIVLRFLAQITVTGTLLSRLAGDLALWTGAEYGFLTMPDRLVGSSSMLPQKRNVFLLEHAQFGSASLLGAFTSATAAMQKSPFSNSISVHTGGVRPVWGAVDTLLDTLTLCRLSVSYARPDAAAMSARAAEAEITATELANRLVRGRGLSFRSAHHLVGDMISRARARGERFEEVAVRELGPLAAGAEPAAVVASTEYGGGPGPRAQARAWRELLEEGTSTRAWLTERQERWRRSTTELSQAVARLHEHEHEHD